MELELLWQETSRNYAKMSEVTLNPGKKVLGRNYFCEQKKVLRAKHCVCGWKT